MLWWWGDAAAGTDIGTDAVAGAPISIPLIGQELTG
jgi:hypothetical protein